MIRSQRRFGVVPMILRAVTAFLVLGIVYAGFVVAAERPSGKTTPDRSLRSTTNRRPVPIDISGMRMRVETREGVLVVYDAAAPPEADEGCSGYIGYWLLAGDKTPYIFPAVLQAEGDLGTVLLALERDLGVDLEALADTDDRVDEALMALSEAPNEEIVWEPATLRRAVEIMGFDPADEPDLNETGDDQTAAPCDPGGCAASLDSPRNCGSPGGLAREAWAVAVLCCAPGGGGGPPPPPPPCTGPCCNDPDPCCGSSNPCCPGCCGDVDCDGIPNSSDTDIDGDGVLNGEDNDVDGDGLLNGSDTDVDGDGILNGSDSDVNNDGILNSGDSDIDGDGLGNGSDSDPDGDGLLNPGDPDDDGDGLPDGVDPEPGGCTTDCPGACCTKATGACASKRESECTGETVYFKGKEKPCSPNPCCAFGSNPVFQPGSVSIRQTEPTHVLANNELGWTDAEPFQPADVSTSVSCDGTNWCAVMTGLVGPYSLQARLGSLQEVTGPGGNTTEVNFCIQVTDLKSTSFFAAFYYMLAAIIAHENVHKEHLLPSLQSQAPLIEGLIERVCVSHVPGKTASAAAAEIRNSTAFLSNVNQAGMWWDVEYRSFMPLDHSGPAYVDERAIVDPMAEFICSHAWSQCWGLCSICGLAPSGACCNPNTGACTTKNRCDCVAVANGGIYRGNDISCGPPSPCMGACCGPGPDYQCTMTTASGCLLTYRGDGTVCTPTFCRPPG